MDSGCNTSMANKVKSYRMSEEAIGHLDTLEKAKVGDGHTEILHVVLAAAVAGLKGKPAAVIREGGGEADERITQLEKQISGEKAENTKLRAKVQELESRPKAVVGDGQEVRVLRERITVMEKNEAFAIETADKAAKERDAIGARYERLEVEVKELRKEQVKTAVVAPVAGKVSDFDQTPEADEQRKKPVAPVFPMDPNWEDPFTGGAIFDPATGRITKE